MEDSSNTHLKVCDNTIEEKQVMRRERNKRKKLRRRLQKEETKRKNAQELREAKAAALEGQRYKAIAQKYAKKWKTSIGKSKEYQLSTFECVSDQLGC